MRLPNDLHQRKTNANMDQAEIDPDPQRIVTRLKDTAIPAIPLESCHNQTVNLASLARESLAIYLYPGSAGFVNEDWQCTIDADAAVHRAFRDRKKDLKSYRCQVAGVSSQPAWLQFHSFARGRLEPDHQLFSDPTLQLADELGLPRSKSPVGDSISS